MNRLKCFLLLALFPLSVSLLAGLIAGCGAVFVNVGSKSASLRDGLQNPDANKPKVIVAPEAMRVCDFETKKAFIDPKLYGIHDGAWKVEGQVKNPWVQEPGAMGTKYAAHISGAFKDKGNGDWPSLSVKLEFRKKGYLDATPFKGIRFYYKASGADTATGRGFTIGIASTMDTGSGGICTIECGNHFKADLSASSDWDQKNVDFATLKRGAGWGGPVTPPEFTEHLDEFMYFSWWHGGNNTPASYTIDFWLDEIEFY